MATTGTEKHCRLCLMLNKGGTKACHSLLLKRVEELTPSDHQPHPWTVHEFLKSKKNEMLMSKISKEKMQVLFPSTGVTDLAKWDLSLFCTVLTTYCGLKQLTCIDVKYLRRFRNELCHMNDPNIDDKKYHDYFETIKIVVERILKEANDDETKQAIDRILEDLHEGPISLSDALKEMRTLYLMEWDIRERLEELRDVEELVLQKVESVDHKLDHIDSKLETSARNNVLLPGVHVVIDLKNLSKDEERSMSVVLEQLFEEVIHEDDEFRSTVHADYYTKLREVVRKTFKRFLLKGWQITSVQSKCVQLHIRCLTLKSLAALFREHVQGHINNVLIDLNSAISETVCERDTQLETIIYKEEFWKVMEKTMSVVDEYLTAEYSEFSATFDKEKQPSEDEKEDVLLITARNISQGEQHFPEEERENDLDTCLTLLKVELGTELNAPHISVTASVTPEKTQMATVGQSSSTGAKLTMLKKQEFQEHAQVEREFKKEVDIRSKGSTRRLTEIVPLRVPVNPSYTQDRYLTTVSSSSLTDVPTVDEHHSKASVDPEKKDELQTIALLELYKSQRAIAHYLELAYLSFNDHSDKANEVLKASQSAREKHLYAADLDWDYHVFGICFYLDDVSEIDITISDAQRLKEVTKYLQESYIELQATIRNLTEHFEHLTSLHKEAKSHVKTKNILEKSTEKERVHHFVELQPKIDIKGTSSEKETEMMYKDVHREMKRMMSESPGMHDIGKQEMKTSKEEELPSIWTKEKPTEEEQTTERVHKVVETEMMCEAVNRQVNWVMGDTPVNRDIRKLEIKTYKVEDWRSFWTKSDDWHDEETIFTKLLPWSALIGDCNSLSYADKLFKSVNRGEELETLMMLQKETRYTVGAMGVQMMQTQRKEALERLDTIRKQENVDGGLECLKEVEQHLKYIDIQFGRIYDCWLQLISGLTLLKPGGGLGTMYKSNMRDRGRRLGKVWSYVRYLFWAYSEVSSSDEEDLYMFLSERGRDDLAERRRELFVVIGKEISGTPFSRDSGKLSDQRSDTDFKGEEKLFFGKGISGTPFCPDSSKLSDQRSDIDFKGKEKKFYGKGISSKPFSLSSGKLFDQRLDTDFKGKRKMAFGKSGTPFTAYVQPSDQQTDY